MKFDYSQQPGLRLKKELNLYNGLDALITVITPYYNAGKYFEQTFNSVMNQTFPWFEWIIINDGSTDTADIALLNSLARKDGRIRVINQENKGVSDARNIGFENACTDIVIPLDADDLISPQYIEYLYFAMLYNPEAAWCYTCSVGFGDEKYLWKYLWDAEKLKTYNFMNYAAAIRKKDWKEIGGYKTEKQIYCEDWRFWLEMLSRHKKPVHTGGYLFWHRKLKNGMHSTMRKHPDKVELYNKIIKNAARKADGTVKAIEYPYKGTKTLYYKPNPLTLGEQYKVDKKNAKTRILMIIPWMVMGGAEKFNLQFISGLNKNIYEISILTTVPSDNDWHQKFEVLTDEIFDLPDFLDSAYFADFVSYYIASRMIDVFLISNSQAGYYMAPWIKSQFPRLLIIDYVHAVEDYWKAGGHARTSAVFGSVIYKTYVCNNATRRTMIEKLGKSADNVKTVYIGVNHKEFNRTNVEKGYLYQLLQVNEERPLILFPCRIDPLKRPFLMLEIADRIRKIREDILFVVIGDGEQLEEIKNAIQIKKLENNVVCVGRCDDMKLCYRDAFLTLICSLREGLALTAYESCSMGVPVISSDVGGQGDLIDDTVGALIPLRQNETEGYDCRKFDEKEIEDYVSAIQNFLNDPIRYKSCSINCREKIENGFSVDNMVMIMEQEMSEGLEKMYINSETYEDEEITKELYVLYNLLEEQERECNDIWNDKCYFESLVQKEEEGKAWLEKHCEEQEKYIDEIQKGRTWLEEQVKYKDMRIKELEDWIKELEKGKEWLEEQVRYKDEQIKELESID